MSPKTENLLQNALDDTFAAFEQELGSHQARVSTGEIGTVRFVGRAIALVAGLPTVRAEELVRFQRGGLGLAFNLDPDKLGVVLLSQPEALRAGYRVYRTGRVMDVPVGESLLGRVLDATGRPLDEAGPLYATGRRPVEREAPGIVEREPVTEPLQTGIKVIDALFPIGRGQRELILGDRQTGKTSVALDTIINQKGRDVICVYCAVGQREAAVAQFVADLRRFEALDYSIVVVAGGQDLPGLQFLAPYAATTMAEYFAERGQDALIVYDDLTRHAWAYRQLSLLLRRPPGREAYPGDIFFLHSRLLERATHLGPEAGGGSLTALPIVETHAQNISAYIPTNLISITDGQIYLSPELFQKGVMPAVDVGQSVSRVGGKAQLPAYREVAGDLKLAYSQFEEIETFARFGTRLDQETRHRLKRGRRVRQAFKQSPYQPWSVPAQIAVLLGVTEGLFDDVSLEEIPPLEETLRQRVPKWLPDLAQRIREGQALEQKDKDALLNLVRKAIDETLEA